MQGSCADTNETTKLANDCLAQTSNEGNEQTTKMCENELNENEEDKDMPKSVVEGSSFYNKVVSKSAIIEPGKRGKRPRISSKCNVFLSEVHVINLALEPELENSVVFGNVDGKKLLQEFEIIIGNSDTEIDRALEAALLNMDEGEKSLVTLSVPFRIEKKKDELPPVSPCLNCVIHLLEVTYLKCPFYEEDEKKLVTASSEKEKGANLFNLGRTVDAFHRFSYAAKILLTCENTEIANPMLSTLFSNMAECQIRQENPSHAIELCRKALHADEKNVKALYRQAAANWSLGDVDRASCLLGKLFELDPNNTAAKKLNEQVQAKIQVYDKQYAEMMKKIFKDLH